jgi:hypothetical protein
MTLTSLLAAGGDVMCCVHREVQQPGASDPYSQSRQRAAAEAPGRSSAAEHAKQVQQQLLQQAQQQQQQQQAQQAQQLQQGHGAPAAKEDKPKKVSVCFAQSRKHVQV